jgi:hypothetical protein
MKTMGNQVIAQSSNPSIENAVTTSMSPPCLASRPPRIRAVDRFRQRSGPGERGLDGRTRCPRVVTSRRGSRPAANH